MLVTMMKAKLHRATVTQADLDYEGSIAIDSELLEASGILPHEQVDVLNITTGARFTTYAIEAPRGSKVIGVNGAAARLVSPGDLVIIISYAVMTDAQARSFTPRVVHVDRSNRIISLGEDPAEPVPGSDQLRGDALLQGAQAAPGDGRIR